jgi:hypothetical protein
MLLLARHAWSQDIRYGTIRGTVGDVDTKTPLPATNVVLLGTDRGTATDVDGAFVIQNVPVGTYTLRFDFIGYQQLIKPNIIVKSERISFVNAKLKMSVIETDGVDVTAGYFVEIDDQPTSTIGFDYEEVRRSPGSAGDISRIAMVLPSVAKINDQTNNLIVRGGSPMENAFFVDNIEIPNINHFPTQGVSGGPIGLINVEFIDDMSFSAGGFSPAYGNKLSSVMDISFREGNRREMDGQVDLNFAGLGGVVEGPLAGGKGSWLLSLRRSYLDFLVETIDVGTSVVPWYADYQGKLTYDVNAEHKLSLLAIWGEDHNSPDSLAAIENDMQFYGNQDISERTTGVNWRALWNANTYSNTSISMTSTEFIEDGYEAGTNRQILRNRSTERAYRLRNVNHLRLSPKHSIEFGFEAIQDHSDFDNLYEEFTDAGGDTTPALPVTGELTGNRFGLFFDYVVNPTARFSARLGARADHFPFSENSYVAPRLALTFKLTDRISISGATGLYYQGLPLLLLAQDEANRDLQEPTAEHYVLGIENMITESTRLSLEGYRKDYKRFPIDGAQPGLFLIDEIYYRYGFYLGHGKLENSGKARSRGIELIVQKKLAREFYGLASAAYARSEYRGGDGIWRDRIFDNRHLFSIEGGYKPNSNWEFSLRWIYAGGPPYTPFDDGASRELRRGVLDLARINEQRYPDYHSLNLRFDRRFHFSRTNLTVYFSVWNAYNRKNVASYYWNVAENSQDTIYQWGILPVFGIEYEF